IGRLQTERDKARVLEGLEGASSSAGKAFDRGRMEQTLAALGNRIFLMNNVHEDEPVLFESRWCLSYLRGPLTKSQIKTLMEPLKGQRSKVNGQGKNSSDNRAPSGPITNDRSPMTSPSARPILPPDVPQHFLPIRGSKPEGSELLYAPMLVGAAEVRF